MPEHIFHIRTLAWHIVFTLCLPAVLFAQVPVVHTESEAEAYNDLLRDLEGISLELNRASAKDLLILPGFTPELARQIIAHRPYRTLEELAHVQGLSEEHIDLIAPYLSIAPSRPWRMQYTSRVTRPSKRANSLGDMRLYQRLQIASPARLSAFFLTERDPEEPAITDYVTGYIALPLSRVNIIIGDVRPRMGAGIALFAPHPQRDRPELCTRPLGHAIGQPHQHRTRRPARHLPERLTHPPVLAPDAWPNDLGRDLWL